MITKLALSCLMAMSLITVYSNDCSPSLVEIYGFETGSVFQYQTIEISATGGNPVSLISVEKYTILDKWIQNDTFSYVRKGLKFSYIEHEINYEPVQYNYYQFQDTISIIDSATHYLNACDSDTVYLGLENNIYSRVLVSDEEGVITKKIGGYQNLLVYNEENKFVEFIDFEHEEIYQNGIGLINQNELIFEYGSAITLQGFVIEGDTSGTIWNDSKFSTSTRSYYEPEAFTIFPSVLENGKILNLVFEIEPVKIEVFSMEGKQQKFDRISNHQISLINSHPGIYIVQVVQNKSRYIQKIIVR